MKFKPNYVIIIVEYEGYGDVYMLNVIIGIIIGVISTIIVNSNKAQKEPDYSELIKRCIEETNKDLTNNGKKKHSNKS